jgi:ferredoxin-NADP reductase
MAAPWQTARVLAVRPEAPRVKTFRLATAEPLAHRAGQHVVVRLTAPDGYTAQRSYSIASAPDETDELELTVELMEGGEVSGYLHEVVQPGDDLEVRGPIGGFFVWEDGPALLIGGGSGVVPLAAMLRLARATGRSDLLRLVVSVRTPADLYYADELPGPEVTVVHSRVAPPDGDRPAGRLTADDLRPLLRPDDTVYVCGSAAFAGFASQLVADLGHPVTQIRVERFGATG